VSEDSDPQERRLQEKARKQHPRLYRIAGLFSALAVVFITGGYLWTSSERFREA
jgi:hypothetical protein